MLRSEITQLYSSQVELIWYGWKKGAPHRFFGEPGETDLWTIPPDAAVRYIHPAQKPVAIAARATGHSCSRCSTPGVTGLVGGAAIVAQVQFCQPVGQTPRSSIDFTTRSMAIRYAATRRFSPRARARAVAASHASKSRSRSSVST